MNTPPHVVVGDEIYYRHPEKGVLCGPVASAGKDGVRVRQGDEHHGVTWEHLLGHKTRKVRRMKIVERGEDGFLAEDEHGQREYVSGEAPEEEEEVPEEEEEVPEEKPVKVETMTKAVDQAVLDAALIKAGFTPSLDYIRATYGDHWSLREDPAVDALWTALADGRARTDEALQGLREDLHKTHVQAYTRTDGTFVQAHEDSRVATKAPPVTQNDDAGRQYQAVEKQYKGTPGWLKAPNGEPSNLNEHQWVVTRTPNFKNWFGDWEGDAQNASRVVDDNGEPLVVYHGSTSDVSDFSAEAKSKKTGNPGAQLGFFFADSPKEASRYAGDWGKDGGNVMAVFLAIKDPYTMPFKEMDDMAMASYRSLMADPEYDPEQVIKFGDREGQRVAAARLAKHEQAAREAVLRRRAELEADGHDGVVSKAGGIREIIAFNSTQIKSATGNAGTFRADDASITKALLP